MYDVLCTGEKQCSAVAHLKMILGPSRKRTSQTRSRWSKGSVYANSVMNQCEQNMVASTPSLFRCEPTLGTCRGADLSAQGRIPGLQCTSCSVLSLCNESEM